MRAGEKVFVRYLKRTVATVEQASSGVVEVGWAFVCLRLDQESIRRPRLLLLMGVQRWLNLEVQATQTRRIGTVASQDGGMRIVARSS